MNVASSFRQAYLIEKKLKEDSQHFFDWYMGTICVITHPSVKARQVKAIILALRTVEHPADSIEGSHQSTETVVLSPLVFFGPIHDFQRSTNGLQIRHGDECLVLVCYCCMFDSH